MTVRKLRNGIQVDAHESHYAIDEGDIKPLNNTLDENGVPIPYIITGSELVENLDVGGINIYIFSEKSNSWNKI